MSPQVYVLCGLGGVGKTTISAAFSIHLAQQGKRTAVLTIDPAKRLADSLQIGELRNKPTRVPLEKGFLDAMMLDPAETFDTFVYENAPNHHEAQQLVHNRYYQFASRKMGGVQEYMAMIRLLSLYTSGSYDAIVLDTPPARNTLEFLQAPQRMAHLMERSAIKFFTKPSGFRAFSLGTETLSKGLKIFLGAEMIDDIALFFTHFAAIGQAMFTHSKQVDIILHQSQFYMCTSSQQSVQDSLVFEQQLTENNYSFAGYLLNRAPLHYPHSLEPHTEEAQQWIEWIEKHTHNTQRRYSEQVRMLKQRAPCWSIPEQYESPNHIEGLQKLTPFLPDITIT